jgi:hypothetical protein
MAANLSFTGTTNLNSRLVQKTTIATKSNVYLATHISYSIANPNA